MRKKKIRNCFSLLLLCGLFFCVTLQAEAQEKEGSSSFLVQNGRVIVGEYAVSREEEESGTGVRTEYHVYVNPYTEEKLDGEDMEFLEHPELIFQEGPASIADGDYKECTSIEQAAAEVRRKLRERETMFEIVYRMESGDNYSGLCSDIFQEALKHTGKPSEGDYLRQASAKAYTKIRSTVNRGIWTGTIQFAVDYYTNAEQEAAVDQKVAEVLKSLALDGKSDYEKIRAIYDYLCQNVTYDDRYLLSTSYTLDRSAYAALLQGTTECSGYALAFYRMALEAGIDTRMIMGSVSGGGTHCWNIVKLGDRYYNLDSTWDAGRTETGYQWFLKCPENFNNHVRYKLYSTDGFNYQYPMANRDYDTGAEAPEEHPQGGTCGEQLAWTLDAQGVLTIRGSGNMADYSDETPSPWEAQKVKKVVLGEGITGIGANAFCYCTNMTEALLPRSLKTVGDYAFAWCGSLKTMALPQGVEKIGEGAFYKCQNIAELSVPGTVRGMGQKAFYDAVALKNVTLQDGVTGLGEFVFQGCVNLKTVSFPLSAADANRNIFTDCLNLADITITGAGPIRAYATDKLAPWNRASIERVVIGNNITGIGDYAFYNMDGLPMIVIPGNVKSVGEQAFAFCDSLEKVTINEGVNTLAKWTFYKCEKLQEVPVPASVTSIGEGAFSACGTLKLIVQWGSAAEQYAEKAKIPFQSEGRGTPNMKSAQNEKKDIKITWEEVPGADGYSVFRKSGSTWKKIADVKGGGKTAYTDKKVESGTKYSYRVCALKNGKAGDTSAGNVSSLYLSVPVLKSAVGRAGKKVTVSWKKTGKADGYELRFKRGKSVKKVKVKKAGTLKRTVGMSGKGTYEVSIRSYKRSGKKTWYSAWSKARKVIVRK